MPVSDPNILAMAANPRFNTRGSDVKKETERAAASMMLMRYLEGTGIKYEEVLPLLAFTAATVCCTIAAQKDSKTCIDRQAVCFMVDFLFYQDAHHAMRVDEELGKFPSPEDLVKSFMRGGHGPVQDV